MKLKYKETPPQCGGSAVPGCGTIHVSEIKPTLKKLTNLLEFDTNLNDLVTGSTGKREYSGDIDLVINDQKYASLGAKAFHCILADKFGREFVARNGDMVHLKFPISKFNAELNEVLPRTGFVQIDFNLGDIGWEKFYHYSDGEESEYKGAHRNLSIAAICAVIDVETSQIVDFYDRPINQIRWKWGPKGLIRVNRHSIQMDGEWHRKQIDTVVKGPVMDPDAISKILFPVDGLESDLRSLETVMAAVKRNYGLVDQERIWQRMAGNFMDWSMGKYFIYPPEIIKYLP